MQKGTNIHNQISLNLIVLLRALIFATLIIFFNTVIDFGTSSYFLVFSSILGSIFSTYIFKKNINHKGFFLSILIIVLGFTFYLKVSNLIWGLFFPGDLTLYNINIHISLCMLVLLITSVSTWCLLKFSHLVTIEFLSLIIFAIYLFSSHRNYKLDNPKIINTLAWKLNLTQVDTLVLFGSIIVSFSFFYLVAIYYAFRKKTITFTPNRLIKTSLVFLTFLLIFGVVGTQLSSYFISKAGSRLSNGVGSENKEGLSPLSFHSALGGTNQPAALLRLDSNYDKNPFSPMLYLREGALSEMAKNEIVIAPNNFDTDTPRISVREKFKKNDPNVNTDNRINILQSVYLLSDQKTPFGIDFPYEITPLKTPDSKFKAAYSVASYAPIFDINFLKNSKIGNPNWSKEEWEHYTKKNENIEYEKLATKLTQNDASFISKAFKLTSYLSEVSIYTLTPNHEIKEGEDPVIPYLFGDKRGYCVHFAHATVYLLRALGIPSRIGLGFLTDLSQAKDGHVLLRMSDRHAWAEVYIDHIGWVPFDTQPQNVESHADTKVDAKLLEDLMGLLQPGDEILNPENYKDESGLKDDNIPIFIPFGLIFKLILFSFILLYILKVYLRYSWLLKNDPRKRVYKSYITILSFLNDLGFIRSSGETRKEFFHKTSKELKVSEFGILKVLYFSIYNQTQTLTEDIQQIDQIRKNDLLKINNISRFQKLLSIISLKSVFLFIRGKI